MKKKVQGLIWIFILLMVASFGFVNWMSASQFKQNYIEIQEQYYSVSCNQVIHKLEESLNYGKEIESFYGINDIFKQLTSVIGEDIRVYIRDQEGKVLYKSNEEPISSVDYELIEFPIHNNDKQVGQLVLAYPNSLINGEVSRQNMEGIKLLLIIMICCSAALSIFMYSIQKMNKPELFIQ